MCSRDLGFFWMANLASNVSNVSLMSTLQFTSGTFFRTAPFSAEDGRLLGLGA